MKLEDQIRKLIAFKKPEPTALYNPAPIDEPKGGVDRGRPDNWCNRPRAPLGGGLPANQSEGWDGGGVWYRPCIRQVGYEEWKNNQAVRAETIASCPMCANNWDATCDFVARNKFGQWAEHFGSTCDLESHCILVYRSPDPDDFPEDGRKGYSYEEFWGAPSPRIGRGIWMTWWDTMRTFFGTSWWGSNETADELLRNTSGGTFFVDELRLDVGGHWTGMTHGIPNPTMRKMFEGGCWRAAIGACCTFSEFGTASCTTTTSSSCKGVFTPGGDCSGQNPCGGGAPNPVQQKEAMDMVMAILKRK
jgi:hypothetical protein